MALEIGAAIATVKALATIAKEAGKAELYKKVLDLQQVLLEMVTENTSLAERNHELSERVRRLEASLDQRAELDSLQFDGQVYWKGSARDHESGPFCPKCRAQERLVRMAERKGFGVTKCVGCKYYVGNGHFQQYPDLLISPPKPRQRR